MQEESEVLRENLRGRVWIDNQIHVKPWPHRKSNSGHSGEKHCLANPFAQSTFSKHDSGKGRKSLAHEVTGSFSTNHARAAHLRIL